MKIKVNPRKNEIGKLMSAELWSFSIEEFMWDIKTCVSILRYVVVPLSLDSCSNSRGSQSGEDG